MGMVAVSAGVVSEGSNILDTFISVGPAVGSIFVAVALIYVFAYLNILNGFEADRSDLRRHLITVVVPLFISFGAIVLYSSLQVV